MIRRSNSGVATRHDLYRPSLAGDCLHQVAEAVEFAEGRVDVRRDANALKLFVNDRRREDPMLVEQITADRSRIDTFDINICDRARLAGIKRRVETDLRNVL